MAYYQDDFNDLFDTKIKVSWTKETWDEHSNKHQLSSFKYASGLIKSALETPTIVLGGFRPMKDGQKHYIVCYYKEHDIKQDIVDYTKVVVGSESKSNFVKTVWRKKAFKNLVLQEKKYNFKEICRDKNCSL